MERKGHQFADRMPRPDTCMSTDHDLTLSIPFSAQLTFISSHNTLLTNLWSTENIFTITADAPSAVLNGATAGTHFRERHKEGAR